MTKGLKDVKQIEKEAPRGIQKGARGAQKELEGHWRSGKLSNFGAPAPPKGSKILEKAAQLAADCRTAGLEGLEDWCWGSNTPWGRRIYLLERIYIVFFTKYSKKNSPGHRPAA